MEASQEMRSGARFGFPFEVQLAPSNGFHTRLNPKPWKSLVSAVDLDHFDCVAGRERVGQEGGIPEQEIEFAEHELAEHDVFTRGLCFNECLRGVEARSAGRAGPTVPGKPDSSGKT